MLKLLDKTTIIEIHANIVSDGQGFNPETYNTDKLDGVLGRIEHNIWYSDIDYDPFELAAIYAEAFARGHAFPDGNKRTAFITAITVLIINTPNLEKWHQDFVKNIGTLQSSSFMTEFMVLVAEGKVSRFEAKQMFMKLFAGTALVIGIGFGVYKLIEFLVDTFSNKK